MTVVELLVSSAVMGFLVTLVAVALLGCMRVWKAAEMRGPVFRSAAFGMESITRSLRGAVAIYSPEVEELEAGYRPLWGKRAPLVVAIAAGPQRGTVGFTYDAQSHRVHRVDYPRSDSPQNFWPTSGPQKGLTICEAGGLLVVLRREGNARFLMVSLESDAFLLPLQSMIRLPQEPPEFPAALRER